MNDCEHDWQPIEGDPDLERCRWCFETWRVPRTHYRASVNSEVPCGAQATVAYSIATASYPPFVDCPRCREAMSAAGVA